MMNLSFGFSRRRAFQLIVLGVAVELAAGCATSGRTAYTPQQLRSELASEVPPGRLRELQVPFEVSDGMIGRALAYTDGPTTDHGKAKLLVAAMTNVTQFGLKWERLTTTNAEETLARGHGNCLSLTSVFVGLARGIGLTAYYVDASDRINTLERSENLLVRTGHIIATVRTERGWSMVDFTGELADYRTFGVIDDREALAHFYNNRGYEVLVTAQARGEGAPWERAMRDFSMATLVVPAFARAHNNLGVAYSKQGHYEQARQAYLAALAADDEFAEPRHNLGNLNLRLGNLDQAIRWYGVAIKMQSQNPYLRYHYGLALYQSGDVEGSIESFERAIALKHDYIEPRNLLAQAYRHQGRYEDAERVSKAVARQRKEIGTD